MNLSQLTPADILAMLKKVDKKTWIKVGSAAAVLGVLLYVLIIPAWFKRVEVKTQVQALKGQVSTTYNLFRKKPELLRIKEDCLKASKEARDRMYTPGEASLLLGTISKMAQASNVTMLASKPKAAEGKFPKPFDDQFEASLYDFTVEGGYHAVGDFISRIESNDKILRILSLTIRVKENSPQAHLVDISISAVSTKKPKAV